MSTGRLLDRLILIDKRAQRWGRAAIPEWLVPMVYNAGLACFPEAPSRMHNVGEIMSQQAAHAARGGRFIVPIPTPVLI